MRIYQTRAFSTFVAYPDVCQVERESVGGIQTDPVQMNIHTFIDSPNWILTRDIDKRLVTHRDDELPDPSELKEWIKAFKYAGCIMCGEHCQAVTLFHHVDRKLKRAEISRMIQGRMPKPMILAEMDKCILLCLNCHRKVHTYLIPCPSI